MRYTQISTDCRIDMPWILDDLFPVDATAAMRDRTEMLMWASDYPHTDGVWPESSKYIEEQFGHLPADVVRKITCENAGTFYGLM